MNQKHWLPNLNSMVLVALLTAGGNEATARTLMEMADEMDRIDEKDFLMAIDKANVCTRMRNFTCSKSQLAKAKKLANGKEDKQMLQAALQNLSNERDAVDEERRREEEAEERERIAEENRLRERYDEPDTNSGTNAGNPFAPNWYSDISKIHNQFVQDTNEIVRQNRAAAEREANRRAAEEAAAREEREATRRRNAERERDMQVARADAERQRIQQLQQAEQERERENEQRRKMQADLLAKQAAERESARQLMLARQKDAKDKADKMAAEQAEKAAKLREEREYLAAMKNGIRLGVKNCFGSYEVGGTMPKIRPQAVSCIDVLYSVRCEGSSTSYRQTFKNFIGMDVGCFGDTSTISPKPACSANDVRLSVDDVTGCS